MSETVEPDLTPMLDVVFILLIFFIITATFVLELGIDTPSQTDKPRDVNASESIVLDLREDSRYYLDDHQIDKRALEHNLAKLHAENPEQSFVLRLSPAATTEAMVYAMDVARILGLETALSPLEPE